MSNLRQLTAGFSLGLILSLGASPVWAQNKIEAIQVSSRLDFDAILITEVDVLFVYDATLAAELDISKSEWYSMKYDLIEAGRGGFDLETVSVPQGFSYQNVSLPEDSELAVKVFVAAYHEPGDIPLRDVTEYSRVMIEIDQFGIIVSDQP